MLFHEMLIQVFWLFDYLVICFFLIDVYDLFVYSIDEFFIPDMYIANIFCSVSFLSSVNSVFWKDRES